MNQIIAKPTIPAINAKIPPIIVLINQSTIPIRNKTKTGTVPLVKPMISFSNWGDTYSVHSEDNAAKDR